MEENVTARMTLHIALSGAVLTALVYFLVGPASGGGALVGATVAVLNWLALRWLLARIMRGTDRKRIGVSLLLVGKMAVLMAVCWMLIAHLDVDALGFIVGISALFIGLALGSARARHLTQEEG